MDDPTDEFECVSPFWIDTEAYSNRDRAMFVAGYEFCLVMRQLESGEPFERPIHAENESRVRMLCGNRKRPCRLEHIDDTWTQLVVK